MENSQNSNPNPNDPKSPSTPKSNPSSTSTAIPTTFVQADTQSFKQVVQMLTGSAETAAKQRSSSNQNPNPTANKNPIPPQRNKPAFKLYERRSSMKNTNINMAISNPNTNNFLISPRNNNSKQQSQTHDQMPSPSVLDFPKLTLSPVTPLTPDPFNRPPAVVADGKSFYASLSHNTTCTTPHRDAEPPKLLALFPLTSPRMDHS